MEKRGLTEKEIQEAKENIARNLSLLKEGWPHAYQLFQDLENAASPKEAQQKIDAFRATQKPPEESGYRPTHAAATVYSFHVPGFSSVGIAAYSPQYVEVSTH